MNADERKARAVDALTSSMLRLEVAITQMSYFDDAEADRLRAAFTKMEATRRKLTIEPFSAARRNQL